MSSRPGGVGTVAALWFACCLLLAAGRTAELSATLVGGLALGWLVLPIVLVGSRPIVPGEWLVRSSLGWAVVQTAVGAALTLASGSGSLSTSRPIVNALAVLPVILVPAWLMATARWFRQRRLASARHRSASRVRSRRTAAILTCLLACALGIAVTVIGTATWSDEAHVFAALSATLTTGLGFTWWIAHRGRPDQRAWLASGFLLMAFMAVDFAVGPLGPFGIAFQSFVFFSLVTALASPHAARASAPTISPAVVPA